jgi:hypothetical protein
MELALSCGKPVCSIPRLDLRQAYNAMIIHLLLYVVLFNSAAAISCPATRAEYLNSADSTVDCSSAVANCRNLLITGNGPSGLCCFYLNDQLVTTTEANIGYNSGLLIEFASTACLKSDRGSNSGTSGGGSGGGTSTPANTGGSGGCIGLSTTCNGLRVFDVVKQKYSFVHGGRTMTRDVLCIDTNSSRICLTPTHVLTLAGQSQTMNELCRKRECSKRREPVFNFWAQNPDEEIECGVFGLTQKVDNRVLAAFSAMNNILLMPRVNWALLRIFHL